MNPPTEDSFVDIHVSVIILAFLVKSVVLIESCDSRIIENHTLKESGLLPICHSALLVASF